MLLLLGILGMLQAMVLPGVLLMCALFPVRSRGLGAGALVGLSFMANYLLAWVLVALALYTHKVMLAVFFLELVLLAALLVRQRAHTRVVGPGPCSAPGDAPVQDLAVLAGKLLMVLFFGYAVVLMLPQVGNIFNGWDAVCSWNRWGVSWGGNTLPVRTFHYPQLVPLVISVPYVFLSNTSLQFFSFAIFLFLLPLGVLACASLQRWREFVFPALLLAAGILMWFSYKGTTFFGYADFPVLYFALLSMVSLLLWSRAGAYPGDRLLVLSLVLAAGAAMAKQAGTYWLLLLPLAIWENARVPWSRRELCRFCGIFLLLLALVAAWYLYVEVLIRHRRELSEIYTVTTLIHKGRSFFERWLLTVKIWPAIWCVWVVALSGVAVRRMRVFALMGLSYTICWSIFFSYSLRNLAIGIPFLFWSSGVGLAWIYDRCRAHFAKSSTGTKIQDASPGALSGKVASLCGVAQEKLPGFLRPQKWQMFVAGILALLCFSVVCGIYSEPIDKHLLALQNERAMALGQKKLNILLSKTMRERKLPLVTIYFAAYTHPDIGYGNVVYAYNESVKWFLENPKIKKPCYMLFYDKERVKELEELGRQGLLHKIGSVGSYHLYLAE